MGAIDQHKQTYLTNRSKAQRIANLEDLICNIADIDDHRLTTPDGKQRTEAPTKLFRTLLERTGMTPWIKSQLKFNFHGRQKKRVNVCVA